MWPFIKKQPQKPFEPYIKIYLDGHGRFTFKLYYGPEMNMFIPGASTIDNIFQAEKYAAEYLESRRKSEDINFISRVPTE